MLTELCGDEKILPFNLPRAQIFVKSLPHLALIFVGDCSINRLRYASASILSVALAQPVLAWGLLVLG